jgi:hypothetical protein
LHLSDVDPERDRADIRERCEERSHEDAVDDCERDE